MKARREEVSSVTCLRIWLFCCDHSQGYTNNMCSTCTCLATLELQFSQSTIMGIISCKYYTWPQVETFQNLCLILNPLLIYSLIIYIPSTLQTHSEKMIKIGRIMPHVVCGVHTIVEPMQLQPFWSCKCVRVFICPRACHCMQLAGGCGWGQREDSTKTSSEGGDIFFSSAIFTVSFDKSYR